MGLSFEWDPRKAATNRRKHGVSFEQAIPVFGDPLARIFDDPDHSVDDPRELIVGHCSRRILLSFASYSAVIGYACSALAARHARKGRIMKKAPRKRSRAGTVGMRPEYRLDYDRAKPNRFASKVPANAVAVVLDPEVTAVFGSSDSVNALLRSVVKAMPNPTKRRRKAG